ncbi:hypothetical protein FRC03_003317 [Tulasnella sp. 419]|nr:hypothetical protein FRC02_000550 [Tulasnella sp. 418]KAG8963170.1 hypothetical protein FRC03_003317 [Tulasnella sp. 419]
MDSSIIAGTTNGDALLLFNGLAGVVRQNPVQVVEKVTTWLDQPESPKFWAGFAYSLRGCAREEMDESYLAREDYSEGVQCFEKLEEELGSQNVERLRNNVSFMNARLRMLGGRVNKGELPPILVEKSVRWCDSVQ